MAHKKAKVVESGQEELKNQLARALADYDNLVKRVEREKSEHRQLLVSRFVLQLLPILDTLYDAQNHLSDSGLAITIKEFEELLKSEGVEQIAVTRGDKLRKF